MHCYMFFQYYFSILVIFMFFGMTLLNTNYSNLGILFLGLSSFMGIIFLDLSLCTIPEEIVDDEEFMDLV